MKNLVRTFSASKKALGALTVLAIVLVGCGSDDAPQVTKVTILSMTPASPATLKYFETDPNDRISIAYDYVVTEPDGARIFILGVPSDGSDGNIYSSSPIYKGSGKKTVVLSYESDEPSVKFEKLRITIYTHDQSDVISETFVDVDYTFTE